MSKVLRNPSSDSTDAYDFKNAKRGVFHERAKIGIKTFEVTDGEDRQRPTQVEKPARPKR